MACERMPQSVHFVKKLFFFLSEHASLVNDTSCVYRIREWLTPLTFLLLFIIFDPPDIAAFMN